MTTELYTGMIGSALGTVAFGVLFGVPKRALLPVGIVGGMSWGVAGALQLMGLSRVAAIFLAAASITSSGSLLAQGMKMPITVFIVPSLIPLVPGATAYFAMLDFLNGHIDDGLLRASQVVLVGGSLALGVVVTGSLPFIRGFRRRPAKS